jgi:hypothetical protein
MIGLWILLMALKPDDDKPKGPGLAAKAGRAAGESLIRRFFS